MADADLPIIDYLKLSATSGNVTDSREACLTERKKFYSSLRDIGFVYLKHPGVNQAFVDTLFAHSSTFFARPQDEKLQILGKMDRGRGPSQGYSCPARLAANPKTSDIKEFFGMYRDDDAEKPNQWLSDEKSQAMRRDLVTFFDSCHQVVSTLLACLAGEIGLPSDAFQDFIRDRNHFIACLFYPATKADSFASRLRSAAHTDYGCLTLLFNDSGEGLQVMTRSGEYRYVARKNDCAIVNVGDLLSRFFNGSLPSTMHRVIEPPGTGRASEENVQDRYSLAFFGHFNADLLVEPLPNLCTPEQPARFPAVIAGEHVLARVKQLHVAGHSTKEDETKMRGQTNPIAAQ